MPHRVDIDFIGLGSAGAAYGGFLHAWSFRDIDGKSWFAEFREDALDAMGSRYLPIYRMADGEYRFLMGRRFNPNRPVIREIAALTVERLRLKNPDRWKTSWGEEYPPSKVRELRTQLIENIRYLSRTGYLACYINDNGLNAFTEYNTELEAFFRKNAIAFSSENYIPFHFAPSLFITSDYHALIQGRTILIVTGVDADKQAKISITLNAMGANQVNFLPISSSSSMMDALDLSGIGAKPDLCLVAAGIGSANILRQLEPLETLCVDIGGLMNCFVTPDVRQHGGVIGLPNI
jgi:hypothetical protein